MLNLQGLFLCFKEKKMNHIDMETRLNGSGQFGIYSSPEGSGAVLKYYQRTIAVPQVVDLGPPTQLSPMYEGETPPLALRDYKISYPSSLIEGYRIACERYDRHFRRVVERHKTWRSDYQYAPFTLAFQVDGPAYSDQFLQQAENMSPEVLAQFITHRVFEFESNIAAYGLNGRLWPDGTTNRTWHEALENIRKRTGKKIAVVAGTEQKLDEMVRYEMGVTRDQLVSEAAVREATGFDAFLGPGDLTRIYDQYQGNDCPYAFFGRTSRPKSWLRDPGSPVDEGIFAQPEILRYVRAFALTHNFDDPNLPSFHPERIMDTKEALVSSGAAYQVTAPGDIYSAEYLDYLAKNGIDPIDITEGCLTKSQKNKFGVLSLTFPSSNLLSKSLIDHLYSRGSDPAQVASGEQKVRAKPMRQHYGIYGHQTGFLNRAKFLNELMEQIRIRGDYIIQPEFANLQIVGSSSPGNSYVAIDRVFFVRGVDGELTPMESCRSLMPVESLDGKKNNVHEGASTRCARIAI